VPANLVYNRDGHGSGEEQIRSPDTFFGSGFEFLEKNGFGAGIGMNGTVYIEYM